mmetsp:Transcript_33707/g.99312  ORF Transcript_33707/g.99312 Transcript_33707/m.99312 type:complete len:705 (+) Transcript_33707:43-2157(+)
MPPWGYIEDASAKTPRIWLSRPLLAASSDHAVGTSSSGGGTSHYFPPSADQTGQCVYGPLRKVDCRAINERIDMLNAAGVPIGDSSTQLGTILVEAGRVTADLDTRTCTFNFYNGPKRALLGAAWFTRIERDGDVVLHPLSEVDGDRVEQLYQRAVSASSSLSDASLDDVLKEYVDLEDERGYKAVIVKVGRTLTMKKKSTSLFGASFNLQRGYGEYTVPGEEDESCLAPPRHLFFVVHGIGEALWSRDDCSVPGVVASTDQARDGMNRKLADAWRADCKRCEKAGEPLPSPPHRIEVIPIEWYSKIHSASSELKNTLLATTLHNIPRLRAIANDVVFDVLTYLTPSFCEEVLETVTMEIIRAFDQFNFVHPNFSPAGGKTSLIGHSLGSVIAWDLLSILKDKQNGNPTYEPEHTKATHEVYAKEDEAGSETRKAGHWGPILTRDMELSLPFVPECTIFLGSPLGLFLSLRGAHPVLDELRKKCDESKRDTQRSSEGIDESLSVMVSEPDPISTKVSPFTLPSGEIFNIFHPADPVGYRIEPLLLPPGTPDRSIPSPAYLTANKGVRLHIQLQEATKNISRSVSGLLGLNMGNAVVAAAASMSQEAERRLSRRSSAAQATATEEIKFALGGRSTRVDYQLQTGIVENEYLSAVTAHGCYFAHEDLLDFVIELSAKVAAKSEKVESVDDHGWEKKKSSIGEVAYA